MTDGYFYRNLYSFKSIISSFFRKYWLSIILLSCAFILGTITGVFTASKYSGKLELEHIPDDAFVSFLCGDKGSFSLFFSYFISFVLILVITLLLSKNKLCTILTFFYILARGYIFGFTIFALITLFGLAGIINAIIIICPCWIILSFLLILIASISIMKNSLLRRYGKYCYESLNIRAIWMILVVLFFIFLFLMCMIFPVIKITIIVK